MRMNTKGWQDLLKSRGVPMVTKSDFIETLESHQLAATNEYDQTSDVLIDIATLGRVFFIVGGPKAAKSFFTYYLAVAISQGTSFLNIQIQKAFTVAYFDTEMLHEDYARRDLAEMQSDSFKVYLLKRHLKATSEANLKILRKLSFEAATKGASVIVIDCIYKIIDVENKKETNLLLSFMNELANKGVLVIGVHHLIKGSFNASRPFDKVSGHSDLVRSIDSGLVLRETDDESTIDSNGRNKAVVEMRTISRLPGIPTQLIYQEANGKHELYVPTAQPANSSMPMNSPAPTVKVKSDEEKLMEFLIDKIPYLEHRALPTERIAELVVESHIAKKSYTKAKLLPEWVREGYLSVVGKKSKSYYLGKKIYGTQTNDTIRKPIK